MIISGLEANKMHFKTQCFVYKHSILAFLITLCYIVLILYDVNLTISPLDIGLPAEFTKGFFMKTSLINILCL